MFFFFFFFQAEDGIRDADVTGVQTCALPISPWLAASCVSRSIVLSRSARSASSVLTRSTRWMPPRRSRRSEERRVGKECRCGWGPEHEKKREQDEGGGECEDGMRCERRQATV